MSKPKQTFPRRCECGGKLKYYRDFGLVFVYCIACTPAEDFEDYKS